MSIFLHDVSTFRARCWAVSQANTFQVEPKSGRLMWPLRQKAVEVEVRSGGLSRPCLEGGAAGGPGQSGAAASRRCRPNYSTVAAAAAAAAAGRGRAEQPMLEYSTSCHPV